ncbi:glycosyltransferase family 4 protein [Paenibacillus sp. B2(2019)]|uniref:glycosyltransferase family 4 protein n=1 Tax=Paenibacillus sp. B2(2019) TaxID=2607754 RepID=UPI0011F1F17C|nr:glycosyltransferase family 4 protein [Paenibacillus sp. B2(2019)]KAA1180576.1 glycosyltransferase family 4 protein [Paenibacillus sp. B2(2019)]
MKGQPVVTYDNKKNKRNNKRCGSIPAEDCGPVRVAFVASIFGHFESFHLPYMALLQQKGCEVHAYAQPGEARLGLEEKGIVCHDVPIQRSPLQMQNWAALGILTESFKEEGFQFIHVHTPVASILGRIAAHKAGVPCTLYTAHGFHFFKGAPFLNWILYYPLERLMARWTDVLITINREDYERAQKFSIRKKVTYVSGVGLDLQVYGSEQDHPETASEKADRRRQLFDLPKSEHDEPPFVILCVAELNANKNQKQLIEALGQLGSQAGNIHLAFAGTGPFEQTLLELANRLGVSDRVHMLGYRRDIPDLLRACDVAALVSYREGLPRAIMEAMAVGKPVIGTHIRGIHDLIEHESTGMLVPVGDITATAKAFTQLRDDPALTTAMGEANKERIIRYGLPAVLREMDSIYIEALNKEERKRVPSEMHASLSGD